MHTPAAASCLLFSVLAPTLASAGATEGVAPTITVTARPGGFAVDASALTKLPPDLHDAPQSVTVLNRDLLQSQAAASLADALRNVPGITLGAAEGGQIGSNINLNGFSARTDLYLDGFRDRGQYYRDTFALQAVEVLMGPSSMLFGRGSTGGVINQVSKTPILRNRAELTASASTNGLGRATGDLNARLGEDSALRIAAMAQQGAISTRRETRVADYALAPSVAFGLGSRSETLASALLQHNNDRPDYGVPPLNGRPAPVDREAVYGFADDHTVQDIAALTASSTVRLSSAFTLRNRLQFNRVTTDARETAAQGVGAVSAAGYAPATANTSALPLDQLYVRLQSHDRSILDRSLFYQGELGAAIRTGSVGHDLLAGVEAGRDRYRNQNSYRNGSCNGLALNPPTGTAGYVGCEPLTAPIFVNSPAAAVSKPGNLATGSADTIAAYVSDTASLTSTLKLVVGLRYDRYAARIANSINSGNTPGNTALAQADQTVRRTSLRVGAVWRPERWQTYHLGWSTSFNPSLEQLTSTTGLTRPLPPEDNRAVEAGARFDLLGDRLTVSGAAFQIDKTNARSQNPDNTYSATGAVRVRGVRLEATGELGRHWRIFAGYARLDGRITNGIATGTQGRIPLNTPRDSATLWTTYRILPRLEVGGGGAYTGARFANNTNLTRVPSYTRFDATAAWTSRSYELRVNVFNLGDRRYYDALIASDGGRATPGAGRTAMLTLTVRPW